MSTPNTLERSGSPPVWISNSNFSQWRLLSKAHKVILAAPSPMFPKRNRHPHPLIYVWGLNFNPPHIDQWMRMSVFFWENLNLKSTQGQATSLQCVSCDYMFRLKGEEKTLCFCMCLFIFIFQENCNHTDHSGEVVSLISFCSPCIFNKCFCCEYSYPHTVLRGLSLSAFPNSMCSRKFSCTQHKKHH